MGNSVQWNETLTEGKMAAPKEIISLVEQFELNI